MICALLLCFEAMGNLVLTTDPGAIAADFARQAQEAFAEMNEEEARSLDDQAQQAQQSGQPDQALKKKQEAEEHRKIAETFRQGAGNSQASNANVRQNQGALTAGDNVQPNVAPPARAAPSLPNSGPGQGPPVSANPEVGPARMPSMGSLSNVDQMPNGNVIASGTDQLGNGYRLRFDDLGALRDYRGTHTAQAGNMTASQMQGVSVEGANGPIPYSGVVRDVSGAAVHQFTRPATATQPGASAQWQTSAFSPGSGNQYQFMAYGHSPPGSGQFSYGLDSSPPASLRPYNPAIRTPTNYYTPPNPPTPSVQDLELIHVAGLSSGTSERAITSRRPPRRWTNQIAELRPCQAPGGINICVRR